MPCALYGKLPAKRDFIAVNVTREFLDCWEPWMHGAITDSRLKLDQAWLPAYLGAPLWRFSLGSGICGVPVAGVFMASIDGVGRHFPLTIAYCAEQGDAFAPLFGDAGTQWFDALETFLLSAIEPALVYDQLVAELDLLPAPGREPAEEPDPRIARLANAHYARVPADAPFKPAFDAIDDERGRIAARGRSLWWTIGGESHDAFAISADGMPDVSIMSLMLTGQPPNDQGSPQ